MIETNSPLFRAKHVAHGQMKEKKALLEHSSVNLKQMLRMPIASSAGIIKLEIWSHGISPAYHRSTENPMQKSYVKPAEELDQSSGDLLELINFLWTI